MGVNYYVALHSANWPTMQALQQCIDRRGWPIKLGSANDSRWTKPLDETPNTLGLPVVFRGERIELEASFVTLSPTQSFSYSLETPATTEIGGGKASVYEPNSVFDFKPNDINETLSGIGAANVRFGFGDRVLTLTFRINKDERQAGYYIMAALIKCFDGYGFELQDRRHGMSTYADSLIRAAGELESGR
jgi:hypothetical protein